METNIEMVVILLIPLAGTLAIFTCLTVVGYARERRLEREALYRKELTEKLLESGQLDPAGLRSWLEDQNRTPVLRRRLGFQVAGVLLLALGVGFVWAFRIMEMREWGLGLIPIFLGLGILVCVATLFRNS